MRIAVLRTGRPRGGTRFRGGEGLLSGRCAPAWDLRARAGKYRLGAIARLQLSSVLLRERFTCDDGAPLGDLGATRELKPTATPTAFSSPTRDYRASSESYARPYLRLCFCYTLFGHPPAHLASLSSALEIAEHQHPGDLPS